MKPVLKQWFGLAVIDTVGSNGSLLSYWRRCRATIDKGQIDKGQRKMFDGVIIYF